MSASCEEGSQGPAHANWMPSGLTASEVSKVAGEASRRSSLGDGSLRGRLLGIRRVRRFRWLFSGSSTISPQYPSSSTSRGCPGSRRQGSHGLSSSSSLQICSPHLGMVNCSQTYSRYTTLFPHFRFRRHPPLSTIHPPLSPLVSSSASNALPLIFCSCFIPLFSILE